MEIHVREIMQILIPIHYLRRVLTDWRTDDGDAIPNVDTSKVKTICHTGDNICENGDIILPAHLTYGENAAEAAAFVAR